MPPNSPPTARLLPPPLSAPTQRERVARDLAGVTATRLGDMKHEHSRVLALVQQERTALEQQEAAIAERLAQASGRRRSLPPLAPAPWARRRRSRLTPRPLGDGASTSTVDTPACRPRGHRAGGGSDGS